MAIIPLTKTLVAAIATGAYDGPTESQLAVWTRQMSLARKQGLRNAAQVADYAATRCAAVIEKCPPTLRSS